MFKARMKFAKEGRAKYISHLDLMSALQRSMARCEMPLWFTEGFNQHAYVSVALPLPTGFSGVCEFLDFHLLSETVPEDSVSKLNAVLPSGLRAIEVYALADGGKKVGEIGFSQYQITYMVQEGEREHLAQQIETLLARPVIEIVKKSKRGETCVNMQDFIQEAQVQISEEGVVLLATTQAGNQNLNPTYITGALMQAYPESAVQDVSYHRTQVYTHDMQPFR